VEAVSQLGKGEIYSSVTDWKHVERKDSVYGYERLEKLELSQGPCSYSPSRWKHTENIGFEPTNRRAIGVNLGQAINVIEGVGGARTCVPTRLCGT
jgi:hypothetical protein